MEASILQIGVHSAQWDEIIFKSAFFFPIL